MRQPARLSLLFAIGLAFACRGKNKDSSSEAEGTQDTADGGTVNGYVDETSTGDDNDEFVQAQDPTSVSGTNLRLLNSTAKLDAILIAADGSTQRQVTSEVAVDGRRFSAAMASGKYYVVSSGGVEALLPPIRVGASSHGLSPVIGAVVDKASSAGVRIFDRLAAHAPSLVAAQTLDLIGLSDLGATASRAERRQPGTLSDANLDLIAQQFVAANQETIAAMQAQGIDDVRFADLMAGAVVAAMASALVEEKAEAGAYDLRLVVAAARASFHQLASEAGSGNVNPAGSVEIFFRKVASDPQTPGLITLVKQRIYDESVVQMTAVLQAVEPSVAAETKVTLWTVIDAQPTTTLADLVSHSAKTSSPVSAFVDAIASSGGDATIIQSAVAAAHKGATVNLAVEASRVNIQTRQSLALNLTLHSPNREGLVSFNNVTTGVDVVADLSLEAAASGQGFYWVPTAVGGSLQLGLAGGTTSGRMVYGANQLRADWDGGGKIISSASVEVVLRDFPIFSQSATAFPENRQTMGGYQGWIGSSPGRLKAADGSTLTVDMFNIINR